MAVANLTLHLTVEPGRGLHLFRGFQGTEAQGDFLHGGDLFAAPAAGFQMRLDVPLNLWLQRAGEEFFEAIHYYSVHKLLPLKNEITTPKCPLRIL
jgi:hypothetical protein